MARPLDLAALQVAWAHLRAGTYLLALAEILLAAAAVFQNLTLLGLGSVFLVPVGLFGCVQSARVAGALGAADPRFGHLARASWLTLGVALLLVGGMTAQGALSEEPGILRPFAGTGLLFTVAVVGTAVLVGAGAQGLLVAFGLLLQRHVRPDAPLLTTYAVAGTLGLVGLGTLPLAFRPAAFDAVLPAAALAAAAVGNLVLYVRAEHRTIAEATTGA
jgi:hypothetical protein